MTSLTTLDKEVLLNISSEKIVNILNSCKRYEE